jgi:hypothetical protein
MPRLTDTQLIILAAAAKREDHCILPLPRKVKLEAEAAADIFKMLIKRKLAAERPATVSDISWRETSDGQRVTLAITEAGLRALGVGSPGEAVSRSPGSTKKLRNRGRSLKTSKPRKSPSAAKARQKAHAGGNRIRAGTKQAGLIEILRRPMGATIQDLAIATGWQVHSVRGVISGVLKKKLGMTVVSEKNESGERRYRLAE